MRIVILGTAHPYRGGLAAFNERLAEVLVESGHEVEIVTFTLQYPGFLFPGESQTDDRPAPTAYSVSQRLNSINPLSYWTTGRYIQQRQPQLIICKFWLPFMAPALGSVLRLAKRGGAQVISIVDNIIPHESRIGDKIFAHYFAGAVDHFIVMSRSVERDMASFTKAGQRVIYHPHPIYDNFGDVVPREDAAAQLHLDPKYRYLLFFGFIRDYKGLDLLLEAMSLVGFGESRQQIGPGHSPGHESQQAQNLKLIVAGEYYGNREIYEAQIARLDLHEQLILRTDFIANEEVKYYFSVADLVVQPYKTATQSGISQMAYHFGVPMVVTAVGGLPEIVPDGEAGYVVDPEPAAIAAAIQQFFALAPDQQDAFRQNVRRLAKQYRWPALVEVIEALTDVKSTTISAV